MNHRRRRARRGFTLLEVVLATAIGVLLLGALYVAVDMQLGYAQMSRDIVQDSTLERALLARMDDDASHVVGLSDPARFRFQAGLDTVSDSATPVASATPTTGAASPTPSTTSTTNMTSASNSSAATDSGTATPVVLPLGVMGDSETLHLFVSNLPAEIYSSGANFSSSDGSVSPPTSDLRRISYWLVGGVDKPGGLARQEVALVTSDDALQNLPPGIDGESSFILADEVRSLNFQYWDGTNWQDSWDSTTLGPDGVTPIGSPLAVAVTIGVARSRNGPGAAKEDETLQTYRHVLVIPTANGLTLHTQAQNGSGAAPTSPSSSQNTNGGGATP